MDIARLDPELDPGAIVVLVDTIELGRRLDDLATGDIVAAQLRADDFLVVNKVDLASEASIDEVLDTLREYNPRAGIVRAIRAQVPIPRAVRSDGRFPRTRGCTGKFVAAAAPPLRSRRDIRALPHDESAEVFAVALIGIVAIDPSRLDLPYSVSSVDPARIA